MSKKNEVKVAKDEILLYIQQADSMEEINTGIKVLKHIRNIGEPLNFNQHALQESENAKNSSNG